MFFVASSHVIFCSSLFFGSNIIGISVNKPEPESDKHAFHNPCLADDLSFLELTAVETRKLCSRSG